MSARCLLLGIAATVSLSGLALSAHAGDLVVKVPATSMPWDLKANKNLPYGKGDGTPAAVAAGLTLTPGMLLHMTATGSTTTVAGGGSFDPNGQADFICDDHVGGSGRPFPSMFINHAFYPIVLNELIAVFTDAKGRIVKSPFPVGSDMTITVPQGAEHLQFGINDDVFADNSGEIDVTIVTSPPAAQ